MMRTFLVAFALLLQSAFAGLEKWRELVVADANQTALSEKSVRITYLGTNGYLLEAPGTKILIDPYFTRIGLSSAALNGSARSSPARVEWGLRHLPSRIDGILVTHGHFDHLLDAPQIAQRTKARLLASPTSIHLARAAGLPALQGIPMSIGEQELVGKARVTALMASHDRLFGCCVPFPGTLEKQPRVAPHRPSQWRCGEPLAFLIEVNGRRIYVDSGGTQAVMPPCWPVDLAILGVALKDSRRRIAPALQRLRPRYFLPSHQDDFFRPLDQGFVFGSLTDFPAVQRTTKSFPARLILLDYFRPWTLR